MRSHSIESDFWSWLAKNPEVEREIVALARRWRTRHPNKPCGVAMLWEILRWTGEMSTVGSDWKLDNRFRSYMARYLMARYPEFAEPPLFETRALRAEEPFEGRLFSMDRVAA